jgi:hypothetical protein
MSCRAMKALLCLRRAEVPQVLGEYMHLASSAHFLLIHSISHCAVEVSIDAAFLWPQIEAGRYSGGCSSYVGSFFSHALLHPALFC